MAATYEGHRCCFEGDVDGLKAWIKGCSKPQDIDELDPQGNTPLLVATMLNRLDCVILLLAANASLESKTKLKWPVLAEAVSVADHQLIKTILLKETERSRLLMNSKTKPILQTLKAKKDFYMEISWDLHSWVPLVSRALPSDTLRIWKKGCQIRLDTTLTGGEQGMTRGNQSVLCIGDESKVEVTIYNVNHDQRVYSKDKLFASHHAKEDVEQEVAQLMMTDLVDLVLETETAQFEHALQGIFGFRTERVDTVGDHSCQVYNCSDVSAVTRVRREHLTPEVRKWTKALKAKLQSGQATEADMEMPNFEPIALYERPDLTFAQYLQTEDYVHLGRPMVVKERKKPHKAAVWMAKDFPLTTDNLLSVLTVLAPASSAVAALKRFVEQRLPDGFPVKLDIPVFPTVSARVTFEKYEEQEVDGTLFNVPNEYVRVDVEKDTAVA
eukprot:m.203546 g.203546  ORF g.203546 m.203546 type:complete len:441 (-) comp17075_c0_seq1:2775-4097(-)